MDLTMYSIAYLHAGAARLLAELRGNPVQMLAWPDASEELALILEDIHERLGRADQLDADGYGHRALDELRRVGLALSNALKFAQEAGMPSDLVEELDRLEFTVGRMVDPGF